MLIQTTDRLIIRQAKQGDHEAFLAYRNDARNMGSQGQNPTSPQDALKFLQRQALLDVDIATGWLMLAVELKSGGRMIGEVGIYISDVDLQQGNIGWSLNADYHGQGFALEAARALLDFAFARRGLRRVTANCDADNQASIRLMDKLGMRREGIFKEGCLRNGVWRDECAYALLQREWKLKA